MEQKENNIKNYIVVLIWLLILSYFLTNKYTSMVLNIILVISVILTLIAMIIDYMDKKDKYLKVKKYLVYLITILWIIMLGQWSITKLINTFLLTDIYKIFQELLFVIGVIFLLFITLYNLIRSVNKEE